MHESEARNGVHVVEFVDESRMRWKVTERDCRKDPGARGAWCLLFASSDVVRRVWDYPPDWHLLPAVALGELSLRR